MIDFYTAATPNGHKVSIALEELSLPYKMHPLNLADNEHKQPWFLNINPNGRIPAIVDRDASDFTVFESGAILIYLAEKTGQLLPASARERSRVLQWLMFQMGGVGPMMGQAKVFGHLFAQRIPAAMDRYQNESRRLLGVLDGHLADHEYLAGDYSIADIATWPWVRNHRWSGVDIDQMPHLRRWLAAIGDRPAVQRGIEQPPSLLGPLPPEAPDLRPTAVVPAVAQAAVVPRDKVPAAPTLVTSAQRPHDGLHQVRELVAITLWGALAGWTDWSSIADFAQENEPWLRGCMDLPAGLPDQTTLRQVIGRIEPLAFSRAVAAWNRMGRPLRGSIDCPVLSARADKARWTQAGTAFVAPNLSDAVEAQLRLLDLSGALVTVHTPGSSPTLAEAIRQQGGHYVLALNHDNTCPTLFEDVRQWLAHCDAVRGGPATDRASALQARIVASNDIDWLADKSEWPGLQAVARITTPQPLNGQAGQASTDDHRHVLCSVDDPKRILDNPGLGDLPADTALDIRFPDRASLERSQANLAVLRRVALQLLSQDRAFPGLSLRRRMMRTQANPTYLQSLLLSPDAARQADRID